MDNQHLEKLWKRSGTEMDEDDRRKEFLDLGRKRHCCGDALQLIASSDTETLVEPHMMSLLSIPNVEQVCSKNSIIFTGTASREGTGPPVGAMDIGVSKSAYYFCIAVPGVKKDPGVVLISNNHAE